MSMSGNDFNANSSGFGGLFPLIGDFFSNPGKPYGDASKELARYFPQQQGYLNPFLKAGQGAIPDFQNWLKSMQNPSGFINNLMGSYQESPYAHYQQDQAMRSAQNMGSASGLTGSTPLTQFAQQNARDISSQDMNQWLQNVLGINSQYGAGQMGLMGQGMQAGNAMSQMLGDYARNQAMLKYGQGAANQGRWGNIIGGIGNFFGL